MAVAKQREPGPVDSSAENLICGVGMIISDEAYLAMRNPMNPTPIRAIVHQTIPQGAEPESFHCRNAGRQRRSIYRIPSKCVPDALEKELVSIF